MRLTAVELEQFTAFGQLSLNFCPGVNVFLGSNGTGKTHVMKVAYAACEITKSGKSFAEKLGRVFLPSGGNLGRLVKRQKGTASARVVVSRAELTLSAKFSNHAKLPASVTVEGQEKWLTTKTEAVFIPAKEMLSHAPGFRSLYAQREIHFDETFADIIDRAFLPVLRGPTDKWRRELLRELEKTMAGEVIVDEEEFFLKNERGKLEFSLLAEGIRKLGLLWILVQNGTLLSGSVLFWDEPEANLNPNLYGPLMEMLLKLQRAGVQVFLATHDYVILKELDLRKTLHDQVRYYGFYHDDTGELQCTSSSSFLSLEPNAILDTFGSLYERELDRSLRGGGE